MVGFSASLSCVETAVVGFVPSLTSAEITAVDVTVSSAFVETTKVGFSIAFVSVEPTKVEGVVGTGVVGSPVSPACEETLGGVPVTSFPTATTAGGSEETNRVDGVVGIGGIGGIGGVGGVGMPVVVASVLATVVGIFLSFVSVCNFCLDVIVAGVPDDFAFEVTSAAVGASVLSASADTTGKDVLIKQFEISRFDKKNDFLKFLIFCSFILITPERI